jgi:hypothetical protein
MAEVAAAAETGEARGGFGRGRGRGYYYLRYFSFSSFEKLL